jgi:hypothetical protein
VDISIFRNLFHQQTGKLLNLEPLELRRLKLDFTYYNAISHNLTPFTPNEAINLYKPLKSFRSKLPHLQKTPKTSNALMSSFLCRVCRRVDAWNSLPSIKSSPCELHCIAFKRGAKRSFVEVYKGRIYKSKCYYLLPCFYSQLIFSGLTFSYTPGHRLVAIRRYILFIISSLLYFHSHNHCTSV